MSTRVPPVRRPFRHSPADGRFRARSDEGAGSAWLRALVEVGVRFATCRGNDVTADMMRQRIELQLRRQVPPSVGLDVRLRARFAAHLALSMSHDGDVAFAGAIAIRTLTSTQAHPLEQRHV